MSIIRSLRNVSTACVVLGLMAQSALASVVMLNTRVIYPAKATSQTVQLTNNDALPYVMQMWADVNNPASTPETADAPFTVVPALFRIDPKSGQSVRLVFNGASLPQDRESVFYLNSVQVPPKNAAGEAQNKMVVVLRNRVKIFYRPTGLAGSPDKVDSQLRFALNQNQGKWTLTVHNDSAYHATLSSIAAVNGSQNIPFNAGMVPPKSQLSLTLKGNAASPAGASKIVFSVVDDHGGKRQSEANL